MGLLYKVNYSVVEFRGATKETMQRMQSFLDQTKAEPLTMTSYISTPTSGPPILVIVLAVKIKTLKNFNPFRKS